MKNILIFFVLFLPAFLVGQNFSFYYGKDSAQVLSINEDTLFLSKGGFVVLPSGGGSPTGPPVFYDSLETGSIYIEAFDSLRIDSVSYYQMTSKGDGFPTYIQTAATAITPFDFKLLGLAASDDIAISMQDSPLGSGIEIGADGGVIGILAEDVLIFPDSSFTVDELSYPFTSPAFDTAALVFNQDGTGYLFDLPEYIAQASGGQTGPPVFYDSLETGSIYIEAFDSLKIDSLNYYQMTAKGDGYPRYLQAAITTPFSAKVAGFAATENLGIEMQGTPAGSIMLIKAEGGGIDIEADDILISPDSSFSVVDLSYPFTPPPTNSSSWTSNTDGTGQFIPLTPLTGSGAPAVAPRYNGDRYFDYTNSKWYSAWDNEDGDGTGDGLDSDDWVILN